MKKKINRNVKRREEQLKRLKIIKRAKRISKLGRKSETKKPSNLGEMSSCDVHQMHNQHQSMVIIQNKTYFGMWTERHWINYSLFMKSRVERLEAIFTEKKNIYEKDQKFFTFQNTMTLGLISIMFMFFGLLVIENAKTTGKNVLKRASNWGMSLNNSIKIRKRKKLFSSTKGSKYWRNGERIVSDEGNEEEEEEEKMSLKSNH